MFLAILRLQEFGGPISATLQGFVLGGGLAMAMLADLRVLDSGASVSLGNLSRGMVPCILLSLILPRGIGLAEAVDLYLTDNIVSAAVWLENSPCDILVDGVAKAEAFVQELERRKTQRPPVVDSTFSIRFACEAAALQLSLRCEVRHIAAVAPKAKEDPQISEGWEAGTVSKTSDSVTVPDGRCPCLKFPKKLRWSESSCFQSL